MRRRIAFGLAALVGALAVVLGGGFRGSDATARAIDREDLTELVAQFSAGSSTAVVSRLEGTVAGQPDDARALALLGLGYQQLYRETADASWLTRANEALSRAVAARRDEPLAVSGLAQLAVTQHRFRTAIPIARRALALDPDNAIARGALGDALIAAGRYPAAFRTYDRLAGMGPSVAAYARIATARQLLGRPAAALDAMELALEAGSAIPEQEAWALTRYGTLLVAANRLGDAEDAFRRALRLSPGYVHARAGQARVAAARGDFAGAASELRQVVDRLPLPEYAILLGDALARADRPEAARRAYSVVSTLERVLAANGVRTELQTALFDIDHGTRTQAALARARAAYAAAPGVAAADAVAWGLARTGRCAEALGWSRRALALGMKDGLFLFHRGMIERCLRGDAAARPWFARALVANPTFSLRWAPLAGRLAS
ncbi:MAG: Tetratricopeptide repeat protein [Thermoleophilia bacterium]|nr:Tetratricopeptide repeat protein [Thermoleophilia bacterium]